jgi:8-oxo-dGTP pyrophosphatase MutT (NUDIX family)
MRSNLPELDSIPTSRAVALSLPDRIEGPVDRVRCVLRCQGRYLLAQHRPRRGETVGKWGLPGGKLKAREKPRAALRRELDEELGLEAPKLARIGDWWHRSKNHRVFGCDVPRATRWFDGDEIVAIAWLDYAAIVNLSLTGQLRTGFELAAVAEFRSRFPAADRAAARGHGRDAAARRRRRG